MTKNTGNQIKVCAITFSIPPFRKLRDCRIEIADRITLIAGHNGIGKSTILGLISSIFGITGGAHKSYFRGPFYTNIEQIIHIALNEVDVNQKNPSAAPTVEATINGRPIRKRCSLTVRSDYKRARVVPRTVDPDDHDPIGTDAKIPLPSIYLGTRRLAAAGEADEKEVSSELITNMDESDCELIAGFVNAVIVGSEATTEITRHSIKGVKKRSAHPGYPGHDTLSISMGQDSLGSIAAALASFNRLQREMGENYPGGLLIIDELDVGFHPHAIDRLIRELKTKAKQLRLQIIATTHSPRMIAALHPDGAGNEKSPDSVVYLVDTKRPRLAEDQSLTAILSDMALDGDADNAAQPPSQNLCVYFEDTEAMQFCEALIPSRKRTVLSKKLKCHTKLMPLGIGGSILVALPNNDPIFKNRVLVVDGDTTVSKKNDRHGNVVKLPCAPGANGTDRSPENTVKAFLRALCDTQSGSLYETMLKLKTSNPSSDKIQNMFFRDGDGSSADRVKSKAWWRKHWTTLHKWGVLALWCKTYPAQADAFTAAFEIAATNVVARR